MDNQKLSLASAPHVKSKTSTQSIMLDVIIALVPAFAAGIYHFGSRALFICAISVVTAVCCEWWYQKAVKKPITITDLSAVVTGLLLAFNLPPTVPYWLPCVGAVFAIIVCKQLFGGLGQNFINPALAARAFLLSSYPRDMTNFILPRGMEIDLSSFATAEGTVIDVATYATPLDHLKDFYDVAVSKQDLSEAFWGRLGGCIGETATYALLIGACYLIIKKVICPIIPCSYIASVFIFSYIFGRNGLYEILLGGLFLGAFFMATDYTTSPLSRLGKLIYGCCCGFLTVIIRKFGSYPEGVSYSILFMNLFVPLFDRYIKPRVFGKGVKKFENHR